MDTPELKVVGPEFLQALFGGTAEPEEMTTPPLLIGNNVRAWEVDLRKMREAAMRRDPSSTLDTDDRSVGAYMVEAPGLNPAFHSYLVHVGYITPEDEPFVEGGTHELQVSALVPGFSRDAFLAGDMPFQITEDPLFCAHFVADNHQAAYARLTATVQEIVDGKLTMPATDELEAGWVERFGDAALSQEWIDSQRKQKAGAAYVASIQQLEAISAFAAVRLPAVVSPAILRTGIDSGKISNEALVRVLVKAGIFSAADYAESLAEVAAEQVQLLAQMAGFPIPLAAAGGGNGDED